MNPEIKRLFAEYLLEAKDPTAAAVLVLADVLRQEPVIIEPDDRQTYGVKEAAELLRTSSKKVYQMCLAGQTPLHPDRRPHPHPSRRGRSLSVKASR